MNDYYEPLYTIGCYKYLEIMYLRVTTFINHVIFKMLMCKIYVIPNFCYFSKIK